MSTSDESLKETGRCAAAAIVEMVAALECDYGRLSEAREELEDTARYITETPITSDASAHIVRAGELNVEIADLERKAGECTSREDAIERIQEDALSVEVRGGWYSITDERPAPEEFNILLSTGGPASRIRGELYGGEPVRAWLDVLDVQDWGAPWTRYFDIDQDTLLSYARCFYYGESS